jgi:hypothetical protein
MAVGVMVKAPGKVVNKAGQRGAHAAQRIGESVARHDLRQRLLSRAPIEPFESRHNEASEIAA